MRIRLLPLVVVLGACCSRSSENLEVSEHVNTIIDSRDGQSYPTMGVSGKSWLALNVDYPTDESWCNGSIDQCAIYGRLYSRKSAMKACPPHWRLPTEREWLDLATSAGGYHDFVKKQSTGDPVAAYTALTVGSFAAQLGGSRTPAAEFIDREGDGVYWTSTSCGQDSTVLIVFNKHTRRVMRDCDTNIGWANAVRCVRP